MKRAFPVIACGAVLFVAAVGCDRNRENTTLRPGETTTTGGETKGTQVPSGGVTTVSAANAVDKITIARCDREASCNNIGADKKFASADACSRDLR